jgi:hypothetical protein
MPSISDIARDKHDLLQRYRASLVEDILEDLRQQAEENSEDELFAWSGEFRSRDEIIQLYNERKKWDRRFLIDTYVLGIVLLLATVGLSFAFKFIAPKPNFEDVIPVAPKVELIDSQTNQ